MRPVRIEKNRDRFVETAIDDEIVIMRLDTGSFFSLSDTAAAIWRLIDGTSNEDVIVSQLQRDFAGNGATIGRDVQEFVSELTEMGLLASD